MEGALLVLIPNQERDLWTRLGLLSERCRIEMHAGRPRPGSPLLWELTVQPRDDEHAAPVRVCHQSLSRAIEDALDQAQAKGWPRGLPASGRSLAGDGGAGPSGRRAGGLPPTRGSWRREYDPADGTA